MPSDKELAFLSQIRERPDDDGPRLIFADFLDEYGDPRGQFIRIQCALDRLAMDDPRRPVLEQQEKDFLDRHEKRWTEGLEGLMVGCTYRRGLIESITVNSAAFLDRGKEIFSYGPIRRVRFSDASHCFAELMDSRFLDQIPEIDLCGNTLGNGGISQLARSKHFANVEYLHLGFNDLTDQGLRALADMPQLAQLRELYLDYNRSLSTPGLRALADSPYMSNLRHLDLSGNSLNESALKVLINGESLKKLDSLVLAGNQIGDGGVEALVRSELLTRMLKRNPALDLRRNNIGPVGMRALGASPIVEPMEELNLAINVIGDSGLSVLAQSPYLRLKRLIISNNRIGDPGVIDLARSRLPETLEYLDLQENFITTESVRIVDEAAKAVHWRKKIEIRYDPGLHLRAPRIRPVE